MFLGFVTKVTVDAHSGATVADLNRVPIWLYESIKLPGLHSDINFSKELTEEQNNTNYRYFKGKIKKTRYLQNSARHDNSNTISAPDLQFTVFLKIIRENL
jgi:hypothetical protein